MRVAVVAYVSDGFFWKIFETVGYKNESMIQGALIVGHTDPTVQVGVGAVFGPQREFWIGGPITAVNYGNAGALRGCAEVRRLRRPAMAMIEIAHMRSL